jgi:hypothetical protein
VKLKGLYYIKSEEYGTVRTRSIANMQRHLKLLDGKLVWDTAPEFSNLETRSHFMDE